MSLAVHVSALTKRYGTRTALDGLDLAVPAGQVVGLIGPNGAGKTTTLRILLDIIRPTAGQVRVLDADPRGGGPALRRRIGYLPGELRLDGRVRGRALLRHYAELSGPVAAGAVEDLAQRLGCDLDRPVRTLSKGNKQKLGLVQAFMHRPELLVLDEPTGGLDPLVQREFLQLVREARDAGQTVLLSSHVLSEIQQVADEVAVLNQGRIVAAGPVASLRLHAVRRIRFGVETTDADRAWAACRSLGELSDLERLPGPTPRMQATLQGDPNPLLRVLAAIGVTELTVEEPDLEESVLRLYGSTDARTELAA
nr:ABC transporter ATP-binding protein [uncultured Friedmanniella sp.]